VIKGKFAISSLSYLAESVRK